MAGSNVYKGKDFTLHAAVEGVVTFTKKNFVRFDGRKYLKTIVNVIPMEAIAAEAKKPAAKAKVAAKVEKKAPAVKKTEVKKPVTKA
jgi:hypothetical protein